MKIVAISVCLAVSLTTLQAHKAPEQNYRSDKAYEAIIHDDFNEAKPYTELSNSLQKLIKDFGLELDDVKFYTATRMNRFVDKVGNNIMLLFPNFFLYLSEEEQLAEIAIQLYRIKNNDYREIPKFNENRAWYKAFKKNSALVAGGLLACMYRNELLHYGSSAVAYLKDFLKTPGGCVAGLYGISNLVAKILYTQNERAAARAAEFGTLDIIGAQSWKEIKKKQIEWGKRKSGWFVYQCYKILGLLDMCYLPEIELQRYEEHEKNH